MSDTPKRSDIAFAADSRFAAVGSWDSMPHAQKLRRSVTCGPLVGRGWMCDAAAGQKFKWFRPPRGEGVKLPHCHPEPHPSRPKFQPCHPELVSGSGTVWLQEPESANCRGVWQRPPDPTTTLHTAPQRQYCHPEPEAKDLLAFRASGSLSAISALTSPLIPGSCDSRTGSLYCGDWVFICVNPGDS